MKSSRDTVSSFVVEHLKTKLKGFVFTNNKIRYELRELYKNNGVIFTQGAVAGCTSILCKKGYIKLVDQINENSGTRRKSNVYEIVDLKEANYMRFGSHKGGIEGRIIKKKQQKKKIHRKDVKEILNLKTKKSLSDRIIDLALEIDNLTMPVRKASSQTLWDELVRRARKAKQ